MKKLQVFEWYLVVEGSGSFPFDMLRYDSAFPYTQEDAAAMESHRIERRRVVVCRRGVNQTDATRARWASFGWRVVSTHSDYGEALDARRATVKT